MKKILATAFALSLLAACSDSTGTSSPGGSDDDPVAPELSIPEGLDEFYTQEIDWSDCDGSGSNECGTVTVPVDYENPDGETIDIAVQIYKQAEDPKGTILVNPGGPGSSGQDLAESPSLYFSSRLLENYNILGFDPRGVAQSAPLDCVSDEDLGRLTDATYPDTPEGEEQAKEDAEFIAKSCEKGGGDLLEFIGTESAARDMDVIRGVLGEEKLDYLGFSYGTHLGAQYADLFPDNVGVMVLDGAIDPAISSVESNHFQAVGFEQALRSYLQFCLDEGDCPLEGNTVDEVLGHLQELLEDSAENPIPTSNPDRPLTQPIFYTGIAIPLYDDTSWSYLTEALRMIVDHNDGSIMQMFGDLMTGRDTDTGAFTDNSLEARWAINCVDYPKDTDEAAWEEANEKLREEAPTFAPFFENGEGMCSQWPYHADDIPGPFVAKGSTPIVVIGTKGDPATPYQSAVNMADQLENGVLITYEGEGHTAYNRSGECVTNAVDSYFIDGTVPEDGLTCPVE